MINFLKGIIVGIGGIAPGLSGSVMLVIFGLYQKSVGSIPSSLKDLIQYTLHGAQHVCINNFIFYSFFSLLFSIYYLFNI